MYRTSYDSSTNTWRGRTTVPMYHPNVNIAQVLLDALAHNPNHVGQISDNNGMRITNRVLRMSTIRVAQNLDRLGIGVGDVIGIVAGNHYDLAPVVMAAFSLGAPINTLDPNFKEAEITHMLAMTRPKIVFCETRNLGIVRESLRGLDLVVPLFTFGAKADGARIVNDLFNETGQEDEFIPKPLQDGLTHTAAIVCSSGTTGSPKGVRLSHASLLEQSSKIFEIKNEDRILTFSSLYWISGLATLVAATMRGITRIITTAPFSPGLMLKVIEKYKVNITLSAPSQVAQLVQCPALETADLSSLNRFYSAGSAISDELCKRINPYLPSDLRAVYGMSEVAGKVSSNIIPTRSGSVGMLVDGLAVRILDDTDEWCGPNQDGEVLIWLDPPFQGYWDNREATREFFTSDGWMKTGDIGHFDDDGYLYLVDRKKDMLKFNGYQISPSEIESIVLGLDGVAAVCVVGVDADETHLPAALVVRGSSGAVTESEICERVKDQLSDSKQLRGGVFFVDTLPTTYSGKFLRRKAKEIATQLYNDRLQME